MRKRNNTESASKSKLQRFSFYLIPKEFATNLIMGFSDFYVGIKSKKSLINNFVTSGCKSKKGMLKAFSLTELLVALVIIGILILLALPVFMPLISKAKSTEAQIQLKHVFTLEQSYFYLKSKYSGAFDEIGFEHSKLVTDGGNANYRIEITDAGPSAFKVVATAVVDFDGDGVFNVWEIDQNQNLVEKTKD